MTSQNPSIRLINPAAISQPTGYTHVVEVTGGKTVYISGQIAFDAEGKVVGVGDLAAQAHQVFANLRAALASVGADFTQVVKLNYYLLDMSQLPAVREIRNQYINTAQPPASTAVQVSGLAHPDLLIEIEAVAVIPA
ncbi:MAG: RidA family protein [Anaerolineae bacterium]|nr:RidA family protein [Anaerolineales bacterium]MCQ3977036.1 RidA family protein [Anaerolineae bacterium]